MEGRSKCRLVPAVRIRRGLRNSFKSPYVTFYNSFAIRHGHNAIVWLGVVLILLS